MTNIFSPYDPAAFPGPPPAGSHPQQSPYGFAPSPREPPRPSVLPVISLVVSVLALVGVATLAIFGGDGGSGPLGDDSLGGTAPLTGQVSVPTSGGLSGSDLSATIKKVVIDDGGDVAEIRCPDTEQVRQGTVSVCHGTISSEAWAVLVVFEDSDGNFTAVPT
jgi:hypothetical protein